MTWRFCCRNLILNILENTTHVHLLMYSIEHIFSFYVARKFFHVLQDPNKTTRNPRFFFRIVGRKLGQTEHSK